MTAMPDRPAGKKSESSSGVDEVVEPSPDEDEDCVDEGPDDAPRDETVDGDEDLIGDDVLDARERRKSTTRKAAGPSVSRVEPTDVVIEESAVPPAPPTEPA
jgi:hypothetical protein